MFIGIPLVVLCIVHSLILLGTRVSLLGLWEEVACVHRCLFRGVPVAAGL